MIKKHFEIIFSTIFFLLFVSYANSLPDWLFGKNDGSKVEKVISQVGDEANKVIKPLNPANTLKEQADKSMKKSEKYNKKSLNSNSNFIKKMNFEKAKKHFTKAQNLRKNAQIEQSNWSILHPEYFKIENPYAKPSQSHSPTHSTDSAAKHVTYYTQDGKVFLGQAANMPLKKVNLHHA